MGWKNVKDHYDIKHNVQVTEQGICIGSDYVHDLFVIDGNGNINYPYSHLGHNDQLEGYVEAMKSDRALLLRLISEPDHFKQSIAVYTYEMGKIIEKQCEEIGWPNCTHDGCIMYTNTFSADRDEVVEWAKRNASAGVESLQDQIEEAEKRLDNRKAKLAEYESALSNLQLQ